MKLSSGSCRTTTTLELASLKGMRVTGILSYLSSVEIQVLRVMGGQVRLLDAAKATK